MNTAKKMNESDTKQPQTAMLSRKESQSKFDIPQHFKDSLSECSRKLQESKNNWGDLDINLNQEDFIGESFKNPISASILDPRSETH